MSQTVLGHEFKDRILFVFEDIAGEYQSIVQDEIISAGYRRDRWQVLFSDDGFVSPDRPVVIDVSPDIITVLLPYREPNTNKLLYKALEDDINSNLQAKGKDLYLFNGITWFVLSGILTDGLSQASRKIGMSYRPAVGIFYHDVLKGNSLGMQWYWHTDHFYNRYLRPIYEMLVVYSNRLYSIPADQQFRYENVIGLVRNKQTPSGQVNPSEPILWFLGLTDDQVKVVFEE